MAPPELFHLLHGISFLERLVVITFPGFDADIRPIACMRSWMTVSGSQERSSNDSKGPAVGFFTFLSRA
jgi:hypothetical protein